MNIFYYSFSFNENDISRFVVGDFLCLGPAFLLIPEIMCSECGAGAK